MKTFPRRGIVAVILLSLVSLFAAAQMPQVPQLPVDPQVRTGKLDNGLTYYIRHNEKPKGQAEFYISQKVGSMQEEESQRGLAHFLEHMAFNGTKHFPGKGLIEYLESIGVKFGYNINAYTSFDETVYTLMNVPVTEQSVIDSCLLVLYDWSCGIALEDKEIDSERSVIHEEWRTGQGAQMRIFEQLLPVIFEGSRYGERLPIGLMEVVDNFPYQVIRDYYHKWYRPDLQGIIVVGDLDVDMVEGKIKSLFSDIKMPENPAERVYFEVPDNKEPIVAFATDKELANVNISVYYKNDPMPKEMRNSQFYFVKGFMDNMVSIMLDARLEELIMKSNPPFIYAGVHNGKMMGITDTKDAFMTVAVADTNLEEAFRALLTETRRVDQHGFTAAEYERAKEEFMQGIETLYNERDKRETKSYMNEYNRAFLDNEPIPGIAVEREVYQQIVPMLPVEAINQYAKELITEENIVIVVQGPDKEGVKYPSKEDLLAVFNDVRTHDTEAYVEEVSDEPLVSNLPAPGKIVETGRDERFDATVWTLSNGAKVVIRPTENKDDEIIMRAVSKGGTSLIPKKYDNEVMMLGDIVELGGLGNFSATNLQKALAGRRASAGISPGEMSDAVMAQCAPRDLETMMQLVYLNFTGLRKDEEAFASWQSRMGAMFQNMRAMPDFMYQDSLLATMYNHNPRMAVPSAESIAAYRYDDALTLIKERMADAADFTFVFVGNVDEQALRPLVEQYVATLPATRSNEKAGEPLLVQKGAVDNYFEKVIETPKVTSTFYISNTFEPTLENVISMDALQQVLFSRYFETMREDEGGTYSPSVHGALEASTREAGLIVKYDTNAEHYKRLAEIVTDEIMKIANDGPTEADFGKVKEYMLKKNAEDLHNNNYWMSSMCKYYLYGVDHMNAYAEKVNALTREDVRDFARKLIEPGNVINVTMNGVTAQ